MALAGASFSLPASSAPQPPRPVATNPPQPPKPEPEPALDAAHTVEIRVALSPNAAQALSEPRIRRLIHIETGSFAILGSGPAGPLGDHIALCWIDQPSPAKVVVEVRLGEHPLQHREVAVRGLAGDVAARLVAIAVSEMVRAAMAPPPAPPPPPPPVPRRTPEEIEQARRDAPTLALAAGGALAVLPSTGVAAGPSLSFAFRRFGAAESIFGRWLEGNNGLRWLELGLGAEYRFHLGRSFRLGVGAQGAFSSVHLSDATSVEGQIGQREAWSARAGGVVAFDIRLPSSFWVALQLEPGAVLRPVHYADAGGGGTVQGAWLGLGVAVHYERVFAAEP